jgi:hypothetical protein
MRVFLLDATSTDGTSATPGWTGLEAQASAGEDHRRAAAMAVATISALCSAAAFLQRRCFCLDATARLRAARSGWRTGPASPDLREGDPGSVDHGVAGTIRTPAEPLPAMSMTLDVRRVC